MRWSAFVSLAFLAAPVTLVAQNNEVRTGPQPDWVRPTDLAEVPASATGVVFVRKQDMLIHLDAAGQSTFVSQHFKLLNSQALQLGNVALVWNPAVGAPTVHAVRVHRDATVINVLDNTTFEVLRRENQLEQAQLDGTLTAVLRVPDLRVGDELEVSYTVPSQDPTLGPHSFGLLAIDQSPPSGRYRIGLDWAAGQEPTLRLPEQLAGSALRTANAIEIRLDDPTPLTPPKNAPARYAWQRVLEYSDFDSWAAVSQRFYPLFAEASEIAAASPLRAEAARIAANHSGKLAQAQAALELVQEQVRYIYVGLDGGNFKPALADETWSRRYGDCKGKTALLLALLRELSIEAEPVLANNSGLDDGFDERLPSPGLFDHVLVRAIVDGKPLWLDGTLPPVARASSTPFVPYRWVLPLKTSREGLARLAWEPAREPDLVEIYEIDAKAGFEVPARIKQTKIQRGIKGLAEYVQFSAVTKDQLEAAFRNELAGTASWNAIDSVVYRYDPDTRSSMLTISGIGPLDWQEDGDERSLTLPGGGFYPPERKQRPADQDQHAPFYEDPVYNCRVTTIDLPDSTAPENWSHNTAIDTSLYEHTYYRTWERSGRTIRMIRGSRTESPEVSVAIAQRDNARLAQFDNSMAKVEYTPAKNSGQLVEESSGPSKWDIDWTMPNAGCLPPRD
jgi:transglutaminase-like putative cysteine protease